jgi:4-oxalocrotonate tautomerase
MLIQGGYMPLVQISLRQGKSPEYRRAIADAVHRAMVETINVPAQDRFQLVNERDATGLIYDPAYLGIQRTDDVVFVQISIKAARWSRRRRSTRASPSSPARRRG